MVRERITLKILDKRGSTSCKLANGPRMLRGSVITRRPNYAESLVNVYPPTSRQVQNASRADPGKPGGKCSFPQVEAGSK